jgi:hypothetical protein
LLSSTDVELTAATDHREERLKRSSIRSAAMLRWPVRLLRFTDEQRYWTLFFLSFRAASVLAARFGSVVNGLIIRA